MMAFDPYIKQQIRVTVYVQVFNAVEKLLSEAVLRKPIRGRGFTQRTS